MVAGYEMTRRCVNLNEVERKISQEKPGGGEGVKTLEAEKAPKRGWLGGLPGTASKAQGGILTQGSNCRR